MKSLIVETYAGVFEKELLVLLYLPLSVIQDLLPSITSPSLEESKSVPANNLES